MFQTFQITPQKPPLSPIDHNTPSMQKIRKNQISDQKFYTPYNIKPQIGLTDQNFSRNNFSQQKSQLSNFQSAQKLPNILNLEFDNKNFSNSKFFTQHSPDFKERKIFEPQEDLESVQKIRFIKEAQQLIDENALKLNLNLNSVSVVFQDVIKHFYIFHNIKLLCAYQMENICHLVNLIHLENQSNLTLIICEQQQQQHKLVNLTNITHLEQLQEIKSGIVAITQQNMLFTSNQTNEEIINSHPTLRNLIYLYDQEKFILTNLLNLRKRVSQLILLNKILPIHQIKEFKNWIDIDTNYFGPLIEFSKTINEQKKISFFKHKQIEYYRPNYKLKPTLFLSRNDNSRQEMILKIVKDLTNQKISQIIIKLESLEEINQLDVFLTKQEYQVYTATSKSQGNSKKMRQFFSLGMEILLTHNLNCLHSNILKQCQVLVHGTMPKSIESLMNDGFFLEEKSTCLYKYQNKGSQIVIVSEKDYIQYRNEIAANKIDYNLIITTIKELLNIGTNYESLFKFQLEKKFKKIIALSELQIQIGCSDSEIKRLVQLLQTNKMIEIIRVIPQKCNFYFDNRKQYKRENSLNFQKSIIQKSRKCLTHSDVVSEGENFELNLIEFSSEQNCNIGDVIKILQSNENFEKVQFENWHIEYNVLQSEKQDQKIDYIIKKLEQINKHEQEDLDLFYCFAMKQSRAACLEKLITFMKEYFGSEHRIMNCEYFNDINNVLPRSEEFVSIKSKNTLHSDIKVFFSFCQIFFSLLLNQLEKITKNCLGQLDIFYLEAILKKRIKQFFFFNYQQQQLKQWFYHALWGKYSTMNIESLEMHIKQIMETYQIEDERMQGWKTKKKVKH